MKPKNNLTFRLLMTMEIIRMSERGGQISFFAVIFFIEKSARKIKFRNGTEKQ